MTDDLNLHLRVMENVRAALRPLIHEINHHAINKGLIPDTRPLPDDPWERALEAKRRRNTGPATPKDWRKR